MDILTVALPIVIGALIGYCTNYIAIKMLFHPRGEVRIGSVKLPFTPGVIPKNRSRIARAVGAAVSERLLTADDLAETMKSPRMKEVVADRIIDGIFSSEMTIKELAGHITGRDAGEIISKAEHAITEKIAEGAKKIDFKSLVKEVAGAAVMEKLQGTMMAMFINESTIGSLAAPIGEYAEEYVANHGYEIINPAVKEEIQRFAELSPEDAVRAAGFEKGMTGLRPIIENIYEKLIGDVLDGAIGCFDVSALVENKINDMDVKELEELVMSVMKRELQTVINLGALIGAVIGIVNVFI